jgi:periplasmic protein TonB
VKSILTAALLAAVVIAPGYAQQPYQMKDEGVKAPVLRKEIKPNYTPDAMRRGVQGRVEMDAVVKADGTVGDVAVTKALDPDLDEQAVTAMKQWQFRPGTKDGKAVDVIVQIEMTFALREKK